MDHPPIDGRMMAETELTEKEKICWACDRPTMEPTGEQALLYAHDGELLKVRLKCRNCGRRSTALRSVIKS